MTRRFGIGKLMAITTLFAVLFGLMKWADFHPIVFAAVAVFVAGIGVAQALLFGGKDPRRASVLSGAFLFPLIWIGSPVIMDWIQGGHYPWEVLNPYVLVVSVIIGVFIGSGFGYMAGFLVACLFLWDARDRDKEDDCPT